MITNCLHCGIELANPRPNKKYCGKTCRTYASHDALPNWKEEQKIRIKKWHLAHPEKWREYEQKKPKFKRIEVKLCPITGKLTTLHGHMKRSPEGQRIVKNKMALANTRKKRGVTEATLVCRECNKDFISTSKRIFCNIKCRKRFNNRIRRHKERARLRLRKVENVNPITVFTKAQWHCQCCGTETPRTLLGQHYPNSPELDHIIPLSKGGEHSYKNTQLLCRECNNKKGNRLMSIA